MKKLGFVLVGMLFGIVFVKAEIVSWFRMQEMFRFQGFHMYGVIGSAVLVAMISLQLIKKFGIKTMQGEPIALEGKKFHKGFIYGSFLFGVGWALTGACPGPLYAQVGAGYSVVIITFIFALLGTYTYGFFQSKLPH
jgi:hypothetical protein